MKYSLSNLVEIDPWLDYFGFLFLHRMVGSEVGAFCSVNVFLGFEELVGKYGGLSKPSERFDEIKQHCSFYSYCDQVSYNYWNVLLPIGSQKSHP